MRRSRARIAHAVTAFLAWAGVVMTVVISAFGAYERGFWEPHLYGIHPDGAAGVVSRLGDTLSYFTMWSNIVVALSATLLALAPQTVTPARRALRLSGLLMITITAIVYALILAPDDVVASSYRYSARKPTFTKTFAEFVRTPRRMERLALNERLYRLGGQVVVDEVYRYEELPAAVADISARLDIELDLPHAKQGSGPHYRDLYGPGDAEIVAERFARTIREFGYEF